MLVITGEGLKTLDAVRGSFETHEIEPDASTSFEAAVRARVAVAVDCPARMAVTVKIPTQLRSVTGGEAETAVDGATTVGEVLDGLYDRYDGLRDRIAEDGDLRRFVNVYVGGEDIRFLDGLDTSVEDGDEVTILPGRRRRLSVRPERPFEGRARHRRAGLPRVRWLAERLLDEGARVVALRRDVDPEARFRTDGVERALRPGAGRPDRLRGARCACSTSTSVDAVFHLAAQTIVGHGEPLAAGHLGGERARHLLAARGVPGAPLARRRASGSWWPPPTRPTATTTSCPTARTPRCSRATRTTCRRRART